MSDLWSNSYDWDKGYAKGHKDGYEQGREDAIDEFVKKIKHKLMNEWNMDLSDCDECMFLMEQLEELSEQMKGAEE